MYVIVIRATRQPLTQMSLPSVEDVNTTRVEKFTDSITEALESVILDGIRTELEEQSRRILDGSSVCSQPVLEACVEHGISFVPFFPLGSAWTPAVVFAYLILIMVFKPTGLLGEQTREAG